jgi:hypothetical protein
VGESIHDGVYDAFANRLAETAGVMKVCRRAGPDAVIVLLINAKGVERSRRMTDADFRSDANGRGYSLRETSGSTEFATAPGADARRSTPRRRLRF